MVALSVPPGVSGGGTLKIYNVVGTLVRTIDLGGLKGGDYYYQNWDGTNDGGRAVASGVYIGEIKVGSQTTFFKMALIKGANQ
jgi:flagellar hook assembly protein FlgD